MFRLRKVSILNRPYSDSRWLEFRNGILEADNYTCVKCRRSSPKVVLQVHHKEYFPNKPPWDYPPQLCETLCKGCHAREHGEIMPNEGWILYSEDDYGGLYGECDLCGTSLRYVFYIQHEKWEPLAVGTDCCDRLTGTTEATESRKLLDRKKRFLSPKLWDRTATGIQTIKNRSTKIEIRPDGENFRIYINGRKGRRSFSFEKSAMEFAFDLFQKGKIQEFAKKYPLPKMSK